LSQAQQASGGAICGILLLDKPVGLSSNAALQRVRHMVGADKAGHVGSLDPLATGMLPICLGEATKVAGEILSGRKLYRFTVGLGTRTATGDMEGEVVESLPVPPFDRASVEVVLQAFMGRQRQIPPMYSAIKRGGQPLYKLARAGIEVEREPREIELFKLPLLSFDATSLDIEALCSKGTYIRTLAEDIARKLGSCGHVTALRRIHVEPFEDQPMETLQSIAEQLEAGRRLRILPADAPLAHLAAVRLNTDATARLLHGQPVPVPAATAGANPENKVRLYDESGTFLGLGETDAHGMVRPRRLFVL
jgi:tRNA pseudouridine55 synthase